MRPNLIQRTIVNSYSLSDLECSYVLPMVNGTKQWYTLVASNSYNGVVGVVSTAAPPNVVVVSTALATLSYVTFSVPASGQTNVTVGAQLYGTYTNTLGTINTSNTVYYYDIFLER
jgi:hypothetical protein